MTLDDVRRSLREAAPPNALDPAGKALWWIGKGDWDRAHDCAQQQEADPACAWVHAHLHRVEGDPSNAAYWYRRAGRPVSTLSPGEEWAEIVSELLARS